jgi:hypothetical protein
MSGAIRAAWTLRYGWERRYQREKLAERFWMRAVDLLPRQLRWATWIRVTAAATTGPPLDGQEVPAIPLGDLLKAVSGRIGPDR